jgi:glycosyltransferase involved in cell wall biosynthesis
MRSNPKFSIIIPTYNRADFISKTIISVLEQDYLNFEIIVIDDGSTDNTSKIVQHFHSDKIKYLNKENEERGAARNSGIELAEGDYVTFLDSDDLLYENHLAEAFRMIREYNFPELFHLSYEIKDEGGKVIRKIKHEKSVNDALLSGNILSCMGVFIRRDIALKHKFNEDPELAGSEDWLYWLQLSARFPIEHTNKITGALINHDSRSVHFVSEKSLSKRTHLLLKYLKEDDVFMSKYSAYLEKIRAHKISYSSLHLALNKESIVALKYLLKAISINVYEIFTRRTLAILKISLLNFLHLRP